MSVCPSANLANNFWGNDGISMELSVNIMPLETAQPLYFVISYHHYYQRDGRANFWNGLDTSAT